MVTTKLSDAVRYAHRAARDHADADLLGAFVARKDEAAFAGLVQRHGRMVLGVCLRLLGHRADAEDAFQATFLVLARRAAAVRPRELVGNWLYGVAYRTALQARAARARRRSREMQLDSPPEPAAADRPPWIELQPALDQELNRLPAKYRVPVVLCELEGRSRADVARVLGIPEGTLSSRLAAARKRLADRLGRRGFALPAGALAAVIAQSASAAVPVSLVASTVRAATGEAVAAPVAALANGVIKGMFLSKLKLTTAAILAVALSGTGVGLVAHAALADQPAPAVAAAPVADPTDDVTDGALPDAADEGKKPAEGEKPGTKPREGDKPGAKPGPRDGERPAAKGETITVSGRVTKEEGKRKRDDGSEITVTTFFLTEAGGNKVALPSPRGGDGDRNTVGKFSPANFVDKEVTLTGLGATAPVREGSTTKRVVRITTITDIKEKKKS
jgi:RNA polymerase sigma factor (sigma-70 family)